MPAETIAYIHEQTGLSCRWLFGADHTASFYGYPVKVEDIFDIYTLLKKKPRELFFSILSGFEKAVSHHG